MPRRPRLEISNIPLHVTQRGVNRGAIFLDDDDRRHFLHLLRLASRENALAIHAYVLMGNHFHLLLSSARPGALSRAMRNLGLCYVQAFNHKYRRSGTLWQGRFKSCLVDSERYVLAVYRYIELNPVRAALIDRPETYPWSSVHANLDLRADDIVTPHACYLDLHHDPSRRAAAYRAWLREGIDDEDLRRIRVHMEQERALGSPRFQAMAEATLGRPVHVRAPGRPRKRNPENGYEEAGGLIPSVPV
jgi:putative transposase